MSVEDYNPLEVDVTAALENTYCIFLNIVEGVGFFPSDNPQEVAAEDVVLLKVSLNGVLFEVLGNIMPQNSILFNNNCIWECNLDDVKRLKTDNRPIKLECLLKSCCSAKSTTMQIGTLLLPLRSVKIIHCLTKLEINPVWHKIHNLSYKWRNNRPQIYLMLVIVKKTLLNQLQMPMNMDTHKISSAEASNNKAQQLSSNVSHTLNMLQTQQNIYVQLLEEIGQIQVGSDPQVDCDVFCVTITFKTIKNIASLFDFVQKFNKIQNSSFIFQYDFLGSISNVEIVINNNDCYTINQKISLNFQSSLKSLRLYFQKIFYIPINLYYLQQNIAIASYRFEISQFLPDDCYFDGEDTSELWMKNGTFYLNRLNNCISNAKVFKPSIDFMITLELLTKNVHTNPCGPMLFRDQDNTHSEMSQRTTMDLEKENLDHVQAVTQYMQLKNSLSHQAKNKCILWRASMKRQSNISENYDSNVYLYNTKTVGVNTERFNTSEYDDLLMQFVQDLNNWKQQEMERFMSELTNSKELYIQEIQTRWQERISQIETQLLKCEKINADLEAIQSKQTTSIGISMKNIQIANEASKEIQLKYNNVLRGLEERMEELSSKIQENDKASTALEERIGYLEKQLTIFQHNILSTSQLRDVLSDMRLQAERFVAMENFYKKKFRNIESETNLLDLKLKKLFNEKVQLKSNDINSSCFNEILNEEQLASCTLSSPILFEPH